MKRLLAAMALTLLGAAPATLAPAPASAQSAPALPTPLPEALAAWSEHYSDIRGDALDLVEAVTAVAGDYGAFLDGEIDAAAYLARIEARHADAMVKLAAIRARLDAFPPLPADGIEDTPVNRRVMAYPAQGAELVEDVQGVIDGYLDDYAAMVDGGPDARKRISRANVDRSVAMIAWDVAATQADIDALGDTDPLQAAYLACVRQSNRLLALMSEFEFAMLFGGDMRPLTDTAVTELRGYDAAIASGRAALASMDPAQDARVAARIETYGPAFDVEEQILYTLDQLGAAMLDARTQDDLAGVNALWDAVYVLDKRRRDLKVERWKRLRGEALE